MKRKFVLFLVTYFLWCLLNWVPDWQHLIIGVFAAGLVAIATGDLFINRPHIAAHPRRYFYFIFYYMPVFFWELIRAGIDVVRRLLCPVLPVNPGIIKIKTTLKSDTALTFLANSITLSTGTMTVDIDKDNGLLYLHCMDIKANDTDSAAKRMVGKFEGILSKIFD